MADIYISVRLSEGGAKAQLLSDALRKRNINSSLCDPTVRWDRHADNTRLSTRLINEADLVVVLVTPLYGRELRGHFGTAEELLLVKQLSKPVFLIRACEHVSVPSVRQFVAEQNQCFEWLLGEPGSPPLPGGLIDAIVTKLMLCRGIEIFVEENVHRIDDSSSQATTESVTAATISVGTLRPGGRAAAERKLREKKDEDARMRSHAIKLTKSGALDILSFSTDAMVTKGLESMLRALDDRLDDGVAAPDGGPVDTGDARGSPAAIEAVAWFRKAAEQSRDKEAALLLAGCLRTGVGGARDDDGAVAWLRKSINPPGLSSQNHAANHTTTSKDSPEVLAALGECYYHGEGVKRDRVEAARLYRAAAVQGWAPAMANLGELLRAGDGLTKDDAEAATWFAAAAEQKLAEGLYGLGQCYEDGAGVDMSLDRASFWYEQAAAQGHASAEEALERLESKIRHI